LWRGFSKCEIGKPFKRTLKPNPIDQEIEKLEEALGLLPISRLNKWSLSKSGMPLYRVSKKEGLLLEGEYPIVDAKCAGGQIRIEMTMATARTAVGSMFLDPESNVLVLYALYLLGLRLRGMSGEEDPKSILVVFLEHLGQFNYLDDTRSGETLRLAKKRHDTRTRRLNKEVERLLAEGKDVDMDALKARFYRIDKERKKIHSLIKPEIEFDSLETFEKMEGKEDIDSSQDLYIDDAETAEAESVETNQDEVDEFDLPDLDSLEVTSSELNAIEVIGHAKNEEISCLSTRNTDLANIDDSLTSEDDLNNETGIEYENAGNMDFENFEL
jgi:hypothetical protein